MNNKASIVSKSKTIIFISISLALLICLSLVFTYAEYTRSSRAKRVVATYDGAGFLFSSNYLSLNSDVVNNVYRRMIYTQKATASATGEITICNYAQGNPTKVYDEDITYKLTAKLVIVYEEGGKTKKRDAEADEIGDRWVKIKYKTDDDNETVTLNRTTAAYDEWDESTLDHRIASGATDICKVMFSPGFNDAEPKNLALYICAQPDDSLGINPLDSTFVTGVSSAASTWTGTFNENPSAGELPKQNHYDGFNYVISGSGTGTFTLRWDNTVLQVSQIFLSKQGLTVTTTEGSNWSYIELEVNSNVIDRYELQFYYAPGASETITSWEDLNDNSTYVQGNYTEN